MVYYDKRFVNMYHVYVEAIVIANKEIGLEVNAEITRYMVMCRDQNAG